jgi:hypothetical protein
MTTTINASTSNGLVQSADGSGIIKLQSNGVTTNALAWVNFNGTGTVAIRSSYNVSSITDNGTGDYTVNFATALSDANYNYVLSVSPTYGVALLVPLPTGNGSGSETSPTTSAFRFSVAAVSNGAFADSKYVSVSIFGN